MLHPFEAMKRGIGLHRDEFDCSFYLSQAPSSADKSAARAEAGNKMGDPPFGLLPDLVCSRVVVRLPVGRIVILIGIEIFTGRFAVSLARFSNRAIRTFLGICQYQ